MFLRQRAHMDLCHPRQARKVVREESSLHKSQRRLDEASETTLTGRAPQDVPGNHPKAAASRPNRTTASSAAQVRPASSLNPAAFSFTPVTNIHSGYGIRQLARQGQGGLPTGAEMQPPTHNEYSGQQKARRATTTRTVRPPTAPEPTRVYLAQSLLPPVLRSSPQRLLVILDLNGTLIARNRRTGTFKERPALHTFLSYIFHHHVPMVFTSARPQNAEKICQVLFTAHQRQKLAAIWGRDRLGLTREQYNEKVQVYKRLENVWANKTIQEKHPEKETIWSQANTVLIDDSLLKGLSQPHNLLLVPEFERSKMESETDAVFRELVLKLEELKMQTDVSRLIRRWQAGVIPAPKAPTSREDQKHDLKTWLAEGAAKPGQSGEEIIPQDIGTVIESSVPFPTSFIDGIERLGILDEDDDVQRELGHQMAQLGTGSVAHNLDR